MHCNNFSCREAGYCQCHDSMPKIAAETGGCLISAIRTVFLLLVLPANRIRLAPTKFEPRLVDNPLINVNMIWTGQAESPEGRLFSGTGWLILSPLFGLLSSAIYGLLFDLGACGVMGTWGGIQRIDRGSLVIVETVRVIGVLTACAAAVNLAVFAYWRKNWMVFRGIMYGRSIRRIQQTFIGLIFILYVLLALFFIAAPIFTLVSSVKRFNSIKSLPASLDRIQKLSGNSNSSSESQNDRKKAKSRISANDMKRNSTP